MQVRKDTSAFQQSTREVAIASITGFSLLFGTYALADPVCPDLVRALALTPALGTAALFLVSRVRRPFAAARRRALYGRRAGDARAALHAHQGINVR